MKDLRFPVRFTPRREAQYSITNFGHKEASALIRYLEYMCVTPKQPGRNAVLFQDNVERLLATLESLTPENCMNKFPVKGEDSDNPKHYGGAYWKFVGKLKRKCKRWITTYDWERYTLAVCAAWGKEPPTRKSMSAEAVFRSAAIKQEEEGRFEGYHLYHFRRWLEEDVFITKACPYREVRLFRRHLINLKERFEKITREECDNEAQWAEIQRIKKWAEDMQAFDFTKKRLTLTIVS